MTVDFADYCQGCGAVLPDDRRAGTIYCSRPCRLKHFDALDKRARAAARAGRRCQECGEIVSAPRRSDQMYCSKACARLAMRKKIWGYRRCRICDTTFLPNHKGQFMCTSPQRFMDCVDRLKERMAAKSAE